MLTTVKLSASWPPIPVATLLVALLVIVLVAAVTVGPRLLARRTARKADGADRAAAIKNSRAPAPKPRRGTVYVLVDESGSVTPETFQWNDRLLLDLLAQARVNDREVVYVGFDHGSSDDRVFRFPHTIAPDETQITMMAIARGRRFGGTDVNDALLRVMAEIVQKNTRDAEVYIVSDAMMPPVNTTHELRLLKDTMRTQVHLVLNNEHNENPAEVLRWAVQSRLVPLADTQIVPDMQASPLDERQVILPTFTFHP